MRIRRKERRMTLTEFENMHFKDESNTEQPVYVFQDEDVFNYSFWGTMRKKCELLFTIASDLKVSAYMKREFADAEVVRWGVIDGQLVVVIKVFEDIF